MPKLFLLVAVVIVLGVAFGAQSFYEQHRQTTCLARVAAFQAAYTKERPVSEDGPSDLTNTSASASKACNEGRYDDARRVISTTGMICRLNNGCGERSRPKGHVISD